MQQKYDYEISFRFVNINAKENIELDKNIFFRKISKEDLAIKYPINKKFCGISRLAEESWFNHSTEIVFKFNGTSDEICKRMTKVEETDYLEKKISNTLLLSGLFDKNLPYATHSYLSSPIRKVCSPHGFNGFTFQPPEIKKSDLDIIKKSYKIINNISQDIVLKRALDRFFVAKKQDSMHINKINNANWDKILSYIIAFETLFLTPAEQELSYRFKLNGTTLISKIDNRDKRVIFNTLSELYNLRSKIVHGSKEKIIKKLAEKIVKILDINDEHHKHSIGLLLLISKQLNIWLYKIFDYLSSLKINERPYSKKDIWEDWLWKN